MWNEKFVFHRIPINATIEFKVVCAQITARTMPQLLALRFEPLLQVYDKNTMLRDVRIGTGRLALQVRVVSTRMP